MNIKTIILWVGAFLIALTVGYYNAVTAPDFPINGELGIAGKEFNYHFDKTIGVKDSLLLLFRSDADSVSGTVRVYGKETTIIPLTIQEHGKRLQAALKTSKLPDTLRYTVVLNHRGNVIQIPQSGMVLQTICYGKTPSQIMQVYYLTLLFGLLLSIRTGLEFFTDGAKVKKLALFTTISFNLFGFFVSPVKRAFELNIIDKQILQPELLFSFSAMAMGLFWIAAAITLFNVKNTRFFALIFGLLSIALYSVVH